MSERALVLVTSSFPTRGDGREAAGVFVRDLAFALAERVPVRVVAPGPAAGRERGDSGFEVFRYAAPEKPLSMLNPFDPRDWAWIVRVVRGGRAATLDAAAGDTAAILALWGLPCGSWARAAARQLGLKYAVWTLGSDIWTLGRLPLVSRVLARVLADATHVYADGLELARDTARIAGRSADFLPSTREIGVLPDKVLRTAPPYRLTFIGRWHPNKGIDLLIRALELLDERTWSRIARVHVCGGGPLENATRDGVARLAAAGRPVTIEGYVDTDRARAVLEDTDYLLIPSRIESIPVVFSDAMKTRCPVVATPVGDLPRLVAHYGVGIVADAVDAPAIARAIDAAVSRAPAASAAGLDAAAADFSLRARIVPELLRLVGAERA